MSWPAGEVINSQARLRRLSQSIPSSYTVHKIGTTYYAETNVAGGTPISNTDASTVIQGALDGLPTGGTVFIRAGTYAIATKLTMTVSEVNLIGEGYGTNLQYSGTDACIEVGDGATDQRSNYVGDLHIDLAGVGATGVKVKGATYFDVFERIKVDGDNVASTVGFDFNAATTWQGMHQLYYLRPVECLEGIKLSGAQDKTNIVILGGVVQGQGAAVANGVGLNLLSVNTLEVYGLNISAAHTACKSTTSYANFLRGLRMENMTTGINMAADANYHRFHQ
jgi:hypothetical protein